MDASGVTLIITIFLAILSIIFIVITFLISEDRINKKTGKRNQDFRARIKLPESENEQREKVKVMATITTRKIGLPYRNQPVKKSLIIDNISLNQRLSPNHWLGNLFKEKGEQSIINVYPYYVSMTKKNVKFGWPSLKYSGGCIDDKYWKFVINVSCNDEVESYRLHDIDLLTARINYNYQNGQMSIPLARGCPFITFEITNVSINIDWQDNVTIIKHNNNGEILYFLENREGEGYFIIISKIIDNDITNNKLSISKFLGVVRIAYYNTIYMKNILLKNYNIYPKNCCIDSTTLLKDNDWDINTNYEWKIGAVGKNFSTTENLLMMALPHHSISNLKFESEEIQHPVVNSRLVTTEHNWLLKNSIPDRHLYLELPPINVNFEKQYRQIFQTEIENISKSAPRETVNWCKWISSFGQLLLVGKSLNEDIDIYKKSFFLQLSLINNSGYISNYNQLIYDDNWGGVISLLGLENNIGDTNNGNAYYHSHLTQYGYLIFAYAVAGFLDRSFLSRHRDTALLFLRDVSNPYQSDCHFPLFRNKDWFFGYSLNSGLLPDISTSKISNSINENIFSYYSCYLLSDLLGEKDFKIYNLTMLTSEISAARHYFLSSSPLKPIFTSRFDTNHYFNNSHHSYLSIMKPFSPISNSYIDFSSANQINLQFKNSIHHYQDPESLAYFLAVTSKYSDISPALNFIQNNYHIYLPYGSLWSIIYLWLLT